MFKRASAFNGDVSRWDVSSVTNMEEMFRDASTFYQNLSMWQLPSNPDTTTIFEGATNMCGEPSFWPVLVQDRGNFEAGCPNV